MNGCSHFLGFLNFNLLNHWACEKLQGYVFCASNWKMHWEVCFGKTRCVPQFLERLLLDRPALHLTLWVIRANRAHAGEDSVYSRASAVDILSRFFIGDPPTITGVL